MLFSYEKRNPAGSIRYVDLVIPEENWEQKVSDIKEYHVDTFVMGDDWEGKFDFLKLTATWCTFRGHRRFLLRRIKADLQKIGSIGNYIVRDFV